MTSKLFSPLTLRELNFRNRIFVSPMCQYSCQDGMPTDWHLVHLGSRATGGAGLVMTEATAVVPEGRISPCDTGIWTTGQAKAFQRIAEFIRSQGAVAGIQLAHAGRKASTDVPWAGGHPLIAGTKGWQPVAPSAIPFSASHPTPRALEQSEIAALVDRFAEAAEWALSASFQVVEIHMAHGYLLHEFLSPLSNHRQDEFGGDIEGRMRLPLQVAQAVRNVWPSGLPVFVRISATDWVDGGWDLAQSIILCRRLRDIGIDLIDCSSGGLVPDARIPFTSGYQVPFAEAIRREAGVAAAAVGLITEPEQAEQTLVCGDADAVFLGREMLRDPYWPLHAARSLGIDASWPVQYERARK
jgi:2,4-dienoyl-CoA reductase-like NADH-dependent reductase (Old Yellow Enzyme family)